MFSALSMTQQLAALFGPHAPVAFVPPGDLRVEEVSVSDTRLLAIGFDYAIAHGSIGAREADQLETALGVAQERRSPVVFLMNTSGVRVTEGGAAIAALRRILRTAIDASLAGLPMLALITRYCFGGASVLATLCTRRVVIADTLFGMSGPKLIERISGKGSFDASDREAVVDLLGGEARGSVSSSFQFVDDSAQGYGAALASWLDSLRPDGTGNEGPGPTLGLLAERLRSAGVRPVGVLEDAWTDEPTERVVKLLLGVTERLYRRGDIVRAESGREGTHRLVGLIGGGFAGVRQIQDLSELIAGMPASVSTVVVVLDCLSHAADATDERFVLSEYLGVLALQVRNLHHKGVAVHVVVVGVSGGGIFAALAAAATRVSMLPSARLQVLPTAAMAAINKSEGANDISPRQAVAVGAIDDILVESEGHHVTAS